MARNYQVVFNDGQWDLRVDGVPRAISRHKSREEAIRVGSAAAERLKVELVVEPDDAEDAEDNYGDHTAETATATAAA